MYYADSRIINLDGTRTLLISIPLISSINLLVANFPISKKGFSNQDFRLGLGGGLQLSIVNARFKVGYMRTLVGLDSDDKNNIFGRIVFRTLF